MSDNNRTFHDTDSPYSLPNDSQEKDRLNRQSNAINTMMGGKIWHAPLDRPSTIIDVGCSTGSNTVQLARAFPSAQVYGIDLSQVTRDQDDPKNIDYIQGNILQLAGNDKRLQAGAADLVTHRMLFLGITDWPGYIRSAYRLLKPGGYLEMQEGSFKFFDRHDKELSNSWKWIQALRQACLERSIDFDCIEMLAPAMEDAGFVDVHVKDFMWSYSSEAWDEHPDSAEIGQYSADILIRTVMGYLRKMLETDGGYGAKEVDDLVEDCQRCLMEIGLGGHTIFRVVLGRKP